MALNLSPFQPGYVVKDDSAAPPDAASLFLKALLGGQEAGVRGYEEAGRNSRSSAQNALDQKRIDFDIAKEKTQQQHLKNLGEAQKQLLPLLMQQGAFAPQQQGGSGVGGQDTPVPQPSGMPAIRQTPSAPSGPIAPRDAFLRVMGTLDGADALDFAKTNMATVEASQTQYEQRRALDKADRMTKDLLSPDQYQQFQLARKLQEGGAEAEIWQSMLPKEHIAIAEGMEKVKLAKNQREADATATPVLVQLGLAAPNETGTIPGAAKILADFRSKLAEQATVARKAAAKDDYDRLVSSLEGAALELATQNPTWNGQKIKEVLRSSSVFTSVPEGVVAKAALEAPKKAIALEAPANEQQAKARMTAIPGLTSLAMVNAMDKKNISLGRLAEYADLDIQQIIGGGPSVGVLASSGKGAIGALAGTAIGTAVGVTLAPEVRRQARAAMSPDEQLLWTSAKNLAAAIYRPESGAAVLPWEVRTTIERYFPLATDAPEVRMFKRSLRTRLEVAINNSAGLTPDLRQRLLESKGAEDEEALRRVQAEAAKPPVKPDTRTLRQRINAKFPTIPITFRLPP